MIPPPNVTAENPNSPESQADASEPASKQDSEFEVSLDVSADDNDGKPIFTINTNLPDETELMLTLSKKKYNGQSHVIVKNGTAVSEPFSNKEKALSGKYVLHVSMSEPRLQSENVKSIVGENGENMTGQFVEVSEINSAKYVSGDFNFTFKAVKEAAEEGQFVEKYDNDIVVCSKMLLDRFITNYKVSLAPQLWTIAEFDEKGAVMALTDVTFESSNEIQKAIIVFTPAMDGDKMTGGTPHYISVGNTVYGNDGYCDEFFSDIENALNAQ